MKASGMDVLRTDVYPRCFYSHKRTVLSEPQIETTGGQIASSKMQKTKERTMEAWKPLWHKAFGVHLFYQHMT